MMTVKREGGEMVMTKRVLCLPDTVDRALTLRSTGAALLREIKK